METINFDKALKLLATSIFIRGESKIVGQYSLIPAYLYNSKPSEFSNAMEFLAECDYTHCDMQWNEKGKSVTLRFYSGESYGAYNITDKDFKKEYIVDIA